MFHCKDEYQCFQVCVTVLNLCVLPLPVDGHFSALPVVEKRYTNICNQNSLFGTFFGESLNPTDQLLAFSDQSLAPVT